MSRSAVRGDYQHSTVLDRTRGLDAARTSAVRADERASGPEDRQHSYTFSGESRHHDPSSARGICAEESGDPADDTGRDRRCPCGLPANRSSMFVPLIAAVSLLVQGEPKDPDTVDQSQGGILPLRTHGGSLAERAFLTGDWGGARPQRSVSRSPKTGSRGTRRFDRSTARAGYPGATRSPSSTRSTAASPASAGNSWTPLGSFNCQGRGTAGTPTPTSDSTSPSKATRARPST